MAKAYRLLHAIMNTAVEDGLIRRNPCRIKGAGQEYSQERPVVPVGTLVKLLDGVPPRYRALLLLATFANLRFGELAGSGVISSTWISASSASRHRPRKWTTGA